MAASLVAGRAHPWHMLGFFAQLEGVLTDAWRVRLQIWDHSDPEEPVRLLPAASEDPDEAVDVTTGAGHRGVGQYAANDPETDLPWTPPAGVKRGRVLWLVQMLEDGEVAEVAREFQTISGVLTAQMGYALVQDLRDEGLSTAYSDARAQQELERWRDIVHLHCRQRFFPVLEDRRVKGRDTRLVQLQEPLYGLRSISCGGVALSAGTVTVTGATGTERRDPKLEMFSSQGGIYARNSADAFPSHLPIVVSGVWGFVEPETLGAPIILRDAVVRGAIISLTGSFSGASSALLKSEKTDDHQVQYATEVRPLRVGGLSILRDPAIREVLTLLRAPIGIGG